MDRLLVLRLRSTGIAADATLNGVPLARTPKAGGDIVLPVHEFIVAGPNRLELRIDPPPAAMPPPPAAPLIGDEGTRAEAALLLPRVGNLASETVARVLCQVAWAATDGEVYARPVSVATEADIPVRFPRWRWLDAPRIEDVEGLRAPAAAYLQDLAISLARGDPEPMLMAARLRFEELALAYQRPVGDDVARWRARVQLLHAQKAMRPPLPTAETLRLRPVADSRLLECLLEDGRPALRCTRPDGSLVYWPMRLAAVERRLYPLR
jgi:hypothetical protein